MENIKIINDDENSGTDRKIFYIDVGSLPNTKAQKYIEQLKKSLEDKNEDNR